MGKKRTTARRTAAATAAATTACPAPPSVVPIVLDDPAIPAATCDFEYEIPPAPTQTPHDMHEASSCLAARTSTLASYTHNSAPSDPLVPRNNVTHSHTTGIDPSKRLAATTCDPREASSEDTYPTPHASSRVDSNTGQSDGYQEVSAEDEDHENGEYIQLASHTTTSAPFALSAARSAAPAFVPAFNNASPALSVAHGSPLDVSAVAEQSDGPAHDSHAPLVTPTSPTTTLAALAACISVHGPPNIILTSHVPVLACTDSRIDAKYDIADTPANPAPKTDAHEPTKCRATTIEEIDEGLLAWIREDATERGWQEGWDAGALHGSAGAYQEGYKAARAEVSTSAGIVDVPIPHGVPITTPHHTALPAQRVPPSDNDTTSAYDNALSSTPGLEPGEPQVAAAMDLSKVPKPEPHTSAVLPADNDARPESPPLDTSIRWARSIFDVHPDLRDAIIDQGKRKGKKEGRKEGREEGKEEGKKEGRDEGYQEGLEVGKKVGTMEGREQGFREGKFEGLKAGIERERAAVRRIHRVATAVQTDELPMRNLADISAQTEPIPPVSPAPARTDLADFVIRTDPGPVASLECPRTRLDSLAGSPQHEQLYIGGIYINAHNIPKDPKKSNMDLQHDHITVNHSTKPVTTTDNLSSAPFFSWADEADSLPISPSTPCSPPPRDFSDLRSNSVVQPFGSLQRRARRSHRHIARAPQSRWSRSMPSSLPSWQSSRPDVSELDWEHDPRLSELGRVLHGLGWVRSSVG